MLQLHRIYRDDIIQGLDLDKIEANKNNLEILKKVPFT